MNPGGKGHAQSEESAPKSEKPTNERARQAFIASLKEDQMNLDQKRVKNLKRKEEAYVEIPVNDCNRCADLGSFVAEIDNDTEDKDVDKILEDDSSSNAKKEDAAGVMKCFMKAVPDPVLDLGLLLKLFGNE
ncbi:MAG: hypothetical protein MZW92_02955 [Comamonadaceae bacterium]|nr:hypothetical protein [Comamonadaceae bacterium]